MPFCAHVFPWHVLARAAFWAGCDPVDVRMYEGGSPVETMKKEVIHA